MSTNKFYVLFLLVLMMSVHSFSQEETQIKVLDTVVEKSSERALKKANKKAEKKARREANKPIFEINPLSPAKAAFYSAVLPGLGQAFNGKYWKIPFVYGAIGFGVYLYSTNNNNYNRARSAYKLMLDGKPHEFDGLNGNIYLDKDALVRAQKSYKKDRDLSLLVSVAFYLLQIVEASTNAHLLQHNVDDNLSFSPTTIKDPASNFQVVGASINFKF